ncbi:ABC transporter ATP-binding protein [Haladaptatus salinisoli]|uniref:ABC transporter ATP-binding protein n=1 Tax=Haladaptatus salinisoli TaxID=2884876 RepID=UPI001D0B66F2|nr:ABC transporter ATP-binding protein [Haladaptatus salinisoli]
MPNNNQRNSESIDVPSTPLSEGDPTRSPILRLHEVTKTYGEERAVRDLSVTVYEGEVLTLLGPSGCGKTTTLRLLAGLDRPTSGTIYLGESCIASDETFVPAEKRGIGLVFQDFALFPHLTIAENIGFGLHNLDTDAKERRINDLLDLINLPEFHDRMPDQLSGGQQQRVALARALAPKPTILLLDEPFSNLDVRLRIDMREEIRRILKTTGVTAISVTHDQEEALSIGDRVAVMNNGNVEQIDRPEAVFQHPQSRFIAEFLGQANFLSGRVHNMHVETGVGVIETNRIDGHQNGAIDILVRPDDLRAIPTNEEDADGYIIHRQYSGTAFIYRIQLTNRNIVHCMHNHSERYEINTPVRVNLIANHTLTAFPQLEKTK